MACRNGDFGEITSRAHALGGSAGNTGALTIAALAIELESDARAQDLAASRRVHERLRAAAGEWHAERSAAVANSHVSISTEAGV